MKLIILDRDGTINEDRDDYVKSADEWVPIAGSLEAIARFNEAGFHVVVATNQAALGKGLIDMAALNAMHSKFHKLLAAKGGRVDAIFFCPHTDEDQCRCRKPQPGLFEQIADRFGLSEADAAHLPLHEVPVVGDTLRDLTAGAPLGTQPYLVLTGKGVKTQQAGGLPPGTQVFADLAAVVNAMLVAQS